MKINLHFFYSYFALILLLYSCKEKEVGEKEAYHALQFQNELNLYPQKILITNQYSKAYTEHIHLKNSNSLRTDLWHWIGPENITGRILSLAINPKDTNELWAGSASSGLWKSESGGFGKNSWENIQTGFPALAIGAIAIDPEHPKTI
ncbi:MAG: hypothetical protein ABIO44_07785, partial [Saprospiraceae bacterium]